MVRIWTDAASSPSWLAAVVEFVGRFWCTRQAAPQWLVRQLNRSDDNFIGILECAALVLALSTFHDLVKGAAATAYTDNHGVLGAVVVGGSRCPKQNNMIAQMWLLMAEDGNAGEFFQVESGANIADGPWSGLILLKSHLNGQTGSVTFGRHQ